MAGGSWELRLPGAAPPLPTHLSQNCRHAPRGTAGQLPLLGPHLPEGTLCRWAGPGRRGEARLPPEGPLPGPQRPGVSARAASALRPVALFSLEKMPPCLIELHINSSEVSQNHRKQVKKQNALTFNPELGL